MHWFYCYCTAKVQIAKKTRRHDTWHTILIATKFKCRSLSLWVICFCSNKCIFSAHIETNNFFSIEWRRAHVCEHDKNVFYRSITLNDTAPAAELKGRLRLFLVILQLNFAFQRIFSREQRTYNSWMRTMQNCFCCCRQYCHAISYLPSLAIWRKWPFIIFYIPCSTHFLTLTQHKKNEVKGVLIVDFFKQITRIERFQLIKMLPLD